MFNLLYIVYIIYLQKFRKYLSSKNDTLSNNMSILCIINLFVFFIINIYILQNFNYYSIYIPLILINLYDITDLCNTHDRLLNQNHTSDHLRFRFNNQKGKLCSICLEQLNLITVCTSCNHYFHKSCILKWMKYKKNCPNCRKYI